MDEGGNIQQSDVMKYTTATITWTNLLKPFPAVSGQHPGAGFTEHTSKGSGLVSCILAHIIKSRHRVFWREGGLERYQNPRRA